MFDPVVVSLSIEADSVRALVTQGRRVSRWGSLPLEPGLVKDGLVAHTEEVGAAIRQLLDSLKVKGPAVTGMSGFHSVHRFLTLPHMPRDLMEKAVLKEASGIMPLSLEEAYFSWQFLFTKDGQDQVFALSVPRELVDAQVQAIIHGGTRASSMDLKPLALARAAYQKDAIIVSLEADSLDIVLVVGAIPQAMRSIPMRLGDPRRAGREDQVVEEVERTLKYYQASHPESPLDLSLPLVLVGQLAQDEALAGAIVSRLGRPLAPLSPPLSYPSHLPLPVYAVNLGLAMKTLSLPSLNGQEGNLHPINLNILPPVYQLPRRTMVQVAAMPGVLLAFALLLPLYQFTTGTVRGTGQAQEQLQRLQQQLQVRRISERRIDELSKTLEAQMARKAELQLRLNSLGEGRKSFSRSLSVAARDALPPGAHLISTNFSRKERVVKGKPLGYDTMLSLSGEAPDSATVFQFSNNLKASNRFRQVWVESIVQKPNGLEFNIKATQ